MNKIDSLSYLSLSCKPCYCSTYVTFLLWSCLRKPCLFFILFNSPHPSTIFSFKTCTVACVCSIGRGLFFDLDQLMSSVNGTLWTYFMNYWIIQFLVEELRWVVQQHYLSRQNINSERRRKWIIWKFFHKYFSGRQ